MTVCLDKSTHSNEYVGQEFHRIKTRNLYAYAVTSNQNDQLFQERFLVCRIKSASLKMNFNKSLILRWH